MWSSIPTTSMRTTPARLPISKRTLSASQFIFSFQWRNKRRRQFSGRLFSAGRLATNRFLLQALCRQKRLHVEVLDKQHLIALFVVDQLIDQSLRDQDSEPAGAHAARIAILQVADRIVRRIGHGSMGDLVQG